MSHYSISTKLGLCILALLLASGTPQAQPRDGSVTLRSGAAFTPPDPISFGNRVQSSDIAQVRAWLDAGLDPDYFADRIGTGLMIAAWNGDLLWPPSRNCLNSAGMNVHFLAHPFSSNHRL